MEKCPEKGTSLNGAEATFNVLEEMSTGYNQCNPHPFDEENAEFKYVKGNVLPPETGSKNLIIPCHEFKSFQLAAKRDAFEQEIKFAKEVIKFAAACMNCRSNGTIHFGIEDGSEYAHGEIVGMPVQNKELFVNARDVYIKRCFLRKYHAHAERSIRPPRFVEVIGDGIGEQRFVIEVDIVPSLSVVKGTFYTVQLPDLGKSEKGALRYFHHSIYKREGASSIRIPSGTIQHIPEYIRDRDFEREKAERDEELSKDDVYRKLSELFTSIKQHMDNEVNYILVTDSCREEDVENLSFLLRMRFFCVLDFDPSGKIHGLYNSDCKASSFSLDECFTESNSLADCVMKDSFQRTSWIFCNGQSHSDWQKPSDANTWMEARGKHLVDMISQLCTAIPEPFEVLFLWLSAANQLVAQAFHEFYARMHAKNHIKCIVQNREYYNSWTSLLDNTCNRDTLNNLSIVGTKLSYLDNMIQTIQSSQQLQHDDTEYEDLLPCIEVLRSDEYSCLEVNVDDEDWKKEIRAKEMHFYKGGKVNWMNFWLAENRLCSNIIKRDAYQQVHNHLNQVLGRASSKKPVITLTISHQPGSGGSTVARYILWDFRKRLKCAIVNTSSNVTSVCAKAKQLQNNERTDKGLPVLLLVEDCDEEYIDDLKINLGQAFATCSSKPSFILLHCKRAILSETFANASDTVHVNYKLSDKEKMLFNSKLKELKVQYDEDSILTFVLMSKEFQQNYLQQSVKKLLTSINQTSDVLNLIGSLALLNHYVEDSYITESQWEKIIKRHAHCEHSQPRSLESTLRKAAGCLLSCLYEPEAELQYIRIIHRKVAEEILNQLTVPQSQIVMKLIEWNVFFKYQSSKHVEKFIRQLFVQRKDNTDKVKLSFPPLIAHICEKEDKIKAEEVLEKACECFAQDAFVAQQFARFLCCEKKFIKAETWVKKAHSLQPSNSYIFHTEGQIYWRWCKSFNPVAQQNEQQTSAQRFRKPLGLALKAIDAFQSSQEMAKAESDWNNAGYFSEVEVGCYVVQLLPWLDTFKSKNGCHMNLIKYLLTDWIPEEVDTVWHMFHQKLKGLHNNICKAMESVYERMAYFYPDKHTEEKHFDLLRKSEEQFLFFFCFFEDSRDQLLKQENMEHLTPILKRHEIFHLGGGRLTKCFSLAPGTLMKIIQLCTNKCDETELRNYILSQIALAIHPYKYTPSEDKISEEELCDLSHTLCALSALGQCPVPYFIQVLLYWPEAEADDDSGEERDTCLIDALNVLDDMYNAKIKDVRAKRKSTRPHFFLGAGSGFQRFVHNTYLGGGNPWEVNPNKLQRIEGWTEGNQLFVQGHCQESKIRIHPGPKCLIPPGSTSASFYLGFTLRGCVAYDIQFE
ncbi:sterile alpha motif domain-containing protein 9-like [Hemiscyllium ocellatum]|uniref:sterile alpha motif domain-containing protein 9-like n=1 Tax=Hemiscyllium ocellatum TaxID=170820 RepID=UPI002966EDF5|nr:sterile alpha motif domain-containing protein 9-like [Hemiscyllium ocellatum]